MYPAIYTNVIAKIDIFELFRQDTKIIAIDGSTINLSADAGLIWEDKPTGI